MDKLRALTFFCRVVETRSFVAAARALDVVPSVLSKAISALEEDLSFRLFHRTTRQVTVTEEGARYYDACKRLLVELEEAETVTRDAVGHPVGRLVVGMHPVINGLLMRNVSRFLATYPDIVMETTLANSPTALLDQHLDVVITAGELADTTLVAQRIGSMRFIVVASPAYLAQHGRPRHPQDLTRHVVCMPARRDFPSFARWTFQRGEETEVVFISPRTISREAVFMQEACLSGGGLSRLFEFPLREHLAAGRLEQLLPDWSCGEQPFHAVFPDRRHIPAKARVFVSYLRSLLARPADASHQDVDGHDTKAR